MKVIYMGTPEFAIKPLQALLNAGHEIVLVVTQPDRPVGRKQILTWPAVKEFAVQQNLKVLQPEKISLCVSELAACNADIMVTCAYGQILNKQILEICPNGILNIHASLLPKYRGASPIQYAILNGEKQTGVTIMQTQTGLDTGDILHSITTDIGFNETAGELSFRLSSIGATAIVEALNKIGQGTAKFTPQPHEFASVVKTIKKEQAKIDFSDTAINIYNKIRAFNPWPVAYSTLNEKPIKIHAAKIIESGSDIIAKPGTVLFADKSYGLIVATGNGWLQITFVQPAGSRVMPAKDFMAGGKIKTGDIFK